MMAPIIAPSPSFVPTWQAFVEEWQDDPNGLPLYLVLADLAGHIARLIEEDSEAELRCIFQAVEDWHINGDPYVREAASIGLLEDLQIRTWSTKTYLQGSSGFSGQNRHVGGTRSRISGSMALRSETTEWIHRSPAQPRADAPCLRWRRVLCFRQSAITSHSPVLGFRRAVTRLNSVSDSPLPAGGARPARRLSTD
jgi:hypothetical protein